MLSVYIMSVNLDGSGDNRLIIPVSFLWRDFGGVFYNEKTISPPGLYNMGISGL